MSCSQRSNLLELINADCAWYFVNTLFQPLLNDPKCTNDNVYCLCSCFLHSGNFNFQVFTFRDFIDYLNVCFSVQWNCHIYNLHFWFVWSLIMIFGLLAAISLSIWILLTYSTGPLVVHSLRQFLLCAHTIPVDAWCCIILPLNVFRSGKFWAARCCVADRLIKLATHSS